MNLQLGWDPVGTAHLGSMYYPHLGEGGSKEGSGSWLRLYTWFIGYCEPDNTQVALQMAWAFLHRVAEFQGSLGIKAWILLKTQHWSHMASARHSPLVRAAQVWAAQVWAGAQAGYGWMGPEGSGRHGESETLLWPLWDNTNFYPSSQCPSTVLTSQGPHHPQLCPRGADLPLGVQTAAACPSGSWHHFSSFSLFCKLKRNTNC